MKKQKNILIVDDVEDVRESLALILEDDGFSTIQAANGLEAMQVMAAHPVDVLITDILMPEMDGIELSTEARNKFPELKIMLISGGGKKIGNKNQYDYLNLTTKLTGIEHVLKKPVNPEEFINLVNQLSGN